MPDEPLEPEVPDAPLEPDVPEEPDEPEVPSPPLAPARFMHHVTLPILGDVAGATGYVIVTSISPFDGS